MAKFFKIVIFFFFVLQSNLFEIYSQKYSVAGFFTLEGSPRQVYNMNPVWKFHKGDVKDAYKVDFDDSDWNIVSLPNGIETLPVEASGGINYRGVVWYRKHFNLDDNFKSKRIVLYFEGIMGKSRIWVNGECVKEHFGGYLPIAVDITEYCKIDEENLISVMADNSDDETYPPGKSQSVLDFCYFGGIYRDCWLYTTSDIYVTDPNMADVVAGGGAYIHYSDVSDKSAKVNVALNVHNDGKPDKMKLILELKDAEGKTVSKRNLTFRADTDNCIKADLLVNSPKLWSPDTPYLYRLDVYVKETDGCVKDAFSKRLGIRSITFSPDKGLILNGKPFGRKLIGANRHQDYALVGNALSNSLHYRDALKLKNAGMDIIRNAHYPQDPAFMDACDELGLFVISNTPGWQFWNDAPLFRERIYSDIRNMIRRDRNRPSIIMWEPILNETNYPDYFAKRVHEIVKEEIPNGTSFTSADLRATGSGYFDIAFTAPLNPDDDTYDKNRIYFTREWGDNVDDWSAHNSPSRVARQWGEIPQLIQAKDYAKSPVGWASVDVFYETMPNHIGGCLWHSFDHQRGYHPDPFYGGVMDAFRRPKYSYYMFRAKSLKTEPMVYIANLMTPFSPSDVTVYSNCEEVHLYTSYGERVRKYKVDKKYEGKPYPVIVFEDAYDFMTDKRYARKGKHDESFLLAKGLKDGKVVAEHKVYPARRTERIELVADTEGVSPEANGGDLITVVAQIVDERGTVKRLNNSFVTFEIEGEGLIVGESKSVPVIWGEACIMVQTTCTPGSIKIKASMSTPGENRPVCGELDLQTVKSSTTLVFDKNDVDKTIVPLPADGVVIKTSGKNEGLKEVEKQQELFEVTKE